MAGHTKQVRLRHRRDVVTWKQILSSACARDPLLVRLDDSPRERASFERDARFRASRRDYLEDVALGAVPEWERAMVHLVAIQDVVRIFAGRLRCGAPVFGRLAEQLEARGLLGSPVDHAQHVIPPFVDVDDSDLPTRDEHAAYLEALAAEESGYEHDPGEANGGVAAHGADPTPDDPNRPSRKPEARGIGAFAMVESIGAIPEIAWHFSASAAELGMRSSFQAQLVGKLLLGTSVAGMSGAAPDGPNGDQIQAATRQRLVRQRLGMLAVHHQADLELAYTDRRYDNPDLVAPYGPGLAPIVWRAAERAGDRDRKGHLKPGKATLRELVKDVRRDWPTYAADVGSGRRRTLEDRIRQAAALVLWTAHEHYRIFGGVQPPRRRRRRRAAPHLVVAGQTGRKRRQLVEAPRKVATRAA